MRYLNDRQVESAATILIERRLIENANELLNKLKKNDTTAVEEYQY